MPHAVLPPLAMPDAPAAALMMPPAAAMFTLKLPLTRCRAPLTSRVTRHSA